MTSDSMMDLAKILQDENRKLTAELAAAKADLDRYRRALELALYYVEGDATYEGVKEKVSRILEGGE